MSTYCHVIHNVNQSNHVKGAPERNRDLFMYRVDSSTELQHLRDYLLDRNIKVISLECVSKPGSKYKSFKLSVPLSEFQGLFDSNLWPNGVHVCKFIPPRPKSSVDNS